MGERINSYKEVITPELFDMAPLPKEDLLDIAFEGTSALETWSQYQCWTEVRKHLPGSLDSHRARMATTLLFMPTLQRIERASFESPNAAWLFSRAIETSDGLTLGVMQFLFNPGPLLMLPWGFKGDDALMPLWVGKAYRMNLSQDRGDYASTMLARILHSCLRHAVRQNRFTFPCQHG